MTTEPVPLRRRKLADEVEDRVLALIQDKGLKPGDKLPSERELMVTYQVGRPAIREAMQNLQRTGLVRIRHGERPRVAEPSMDAMVERMAQSMRHLLTHSEATMKHLKDARVVFESEMARIAAGNRTAADLNKLKAVIDRQSQLRNDASAFLECDGEFHSMISAMSGNPIFESLSHSLFGWLAHFHVDMVRKPGLEKLTLEEHRAIFSAIEAGDGKLAGRLMADHLNRANSLYHQNNPAAPSA
jgi:DNA-binding FadR family transcriptional regulator